jgi:very-short-patch-repair endonuclease
MVVDFYCPELRLALELDGGHHATPQQRARDLARTAMLNARGIRVVRVPNADVTTAHLVALIQSLSAPLRIGGEGAGG